MKKSAVPLGLSGIYVGKGDAAATSSNLNATKTNPPTAEKKFPSQSISPTRGASVLSNNSPGQNVLVQNTQMTVRRSVSPSQNNISPPRQQSNLQPTGNGPIAPTASTSTTRRPSISPSRASQLRASSPPPNPTQPQSATQSSSVKPKNSASNPTPSRTSSPPPRPASATKPQNHAPTSQPTVEKSAPTHSNNKVKNSGPPDSEHQPDSRPSSSQRMPRLQHATSEKKLKLKEAVVGKTLRSQKMEMRLKSAAERNSESLQSEDTFEESDEISHVPSSASGSYESSGRTKIYAPDTSTYGISGSLSGRTKRILEKQQKLEGITKNEKITTQPKKEESPKVNIRVPEAQEDRRNPPHLSPIEERDSEASSIFSRMPNSPPMPYMMPPYHPHHPPPSYGGYPAHMGYPPAYPGGYYMPPGPPGYPSYPSPNYYPYGPPNGYPMYPPQPQGGGDQGMVPQHASIARQVTSPDPPTQPSLHINTNTPDDVTDCEVSADEQPEPQPPNLDALMMAKQFMILQNALKSPADPSGQAEAESNPLVMFFQQILKQQQQSQQELEAPSAPEPLVVDVQGEENRKLQEQVKFLQEQITQIQKQQQEQQLLKQLSSTSSISSSGSGVTSVLSNEQEEDLLISEIIEELLEEMERVLFLKEKREKKAREVEALEINKRLLAQIQKLTDEVTTMKHSPTTAATAAVSIDSPKPGKHFPSSPTEPPFTPNSERAYQLAAKEHKSRTGKELPRVLYRLVPNRSKFKGANELFHSDIDLVVEIASALKKEASNATLGSIDQESDVDYRSSYDHTVSFDYYEMAKNSMCGVADDDAALGGSGSSKPSRPQRGSKFSIENPLLQTQDDISVHSSSSTSSSSASLAPFAALRSKRGSKDDLEIDASKSMLLAAACRPVRWTGRNKKFENR